MAENHMLASMYGQNPGSVQWGLRMLTGEDVTYLRCVRVPKPLLASRAHFKI